MAALVEAFPSRREALRKAARNHGYDQLKEEQLLALEKFVTGSDVFVSLPTGFGKSLIYGLMITGSLRSSQMVHRTNVIASQQGDAAGTNVIAGVKLGFLKREIGDPQTLQYIAFDDVSHRFCR